MKEGPLTPGGDAVAGLFEDRADDAPDLPHGPAKGPPWGWASGAASPAKRDEEARVKQGQARSNTVKQGQTHNLLTCLTCT